MISLFTYSIVACFTYEFIGFLIIPSVCGVEYLTEPPSYVPPCRIYEPEFTKCSTHSIQQMFNQVIKGIPEIEKSFGPMEPMFVKKIIFKQDNNEVATIRADLSDLVIKGFGKTIIKQSKVSKKDFSWETKLLIPNLRIDGNYKMNGKVLLVPLKGNGKFFIEIDNLEVIAYSKTRLYEKGGFTFYNVTNIRVHLTPRGVKTNFENLFRGKKEIENRTNIFFNENWQDFFEALRPVIGQTIEEILLDLMKKIFDFIPANFFVADIPTSKKLYGN